jgi:hypothetical protein
MKSTIHSISLLCGIALIAIAIQKTDYIIGLIGSYITFISIVQLVLLGVNNEK